MPDLGIFDQKCLIWIFLGYNFKRTIVIFEISNLWTFPIAKYCEIMKMLKFGTKSALSGYFLLEFWKTLVIFEISTLELVQLQNFEKKQNCLDLGPKMPSLGIFDQKCIIWVFSGKNSFKKLLSYLKLAPSNLSICKISRKNENA